MHIIIHRPLPLASLLHRGVSFDKPHDITPTPLPRLCAPAVQSAPTIVTHTEGVFVLCRMTIFTPP